MTVLRLATVVFLSALAVGTAQAGTLEDCYQTADPALQVGACTSLIEGGALQGLALAKVYTGRGVGYGNLGDAVRARADHDRAIAIAPDFALALSNRASLAMSGGDFEAAIPDLDRAIALDPKSFRALNGRAWAKYKLGRAADGLGDIEAALALKPGLAALLDTKGHILEALGRRDEAITAYRSALAADPGLAGSKEGLQRLGAAP